MEKERNAITNENQICLNQNELMDIRCWLKYNSKKGLGGLLCM